MTTTVPFSKTTTSGRRSSRGSSYSRIAANCDAAGSLSTQPDAALRNTSMLDAHAENCSLPRCRNLPTRLDARAAGSEAISVAKSPTHPHGSRAEDTPDPQALPRTRQGYSTTPTTRAEPQPLPLV